jgi:hypothetical protein
MEKDEVPGKREENEQETKEFMVGTLGKAVWCSIKG